MSDNPLLSAANAGAGITRQSPAPAPSAAPDAAACQVRLDQALNEISLNRWLVSEAESVRAQRNVLLMVLAVGGVVWWLTARRN